MKSIYVFLAISLSTAIFASEDNRVELLENKIESLENRLEYTQSSSVKTRERKKSRSRGNADLRTVSFNRALTDYRTDHSSKDYRSSFIGFSLGNSWSCEFITLDWSWLSVEQFFPGNRWQ